MLLEIESLTKVYARGVRANDDVSLRVDSGEILGLLGHNGAGKTTLLNQVAGVAKPTSGTIRIDGRDAVSAPAMARQMCSMQPQAQAPLNGVTPRQAIEIMARIRGASRRRARQRTEELLASLEMEPWANTVGERLSGGIQRLTGFCMAAAEPGRVVMFDEPTNDVDPVRRKLLWSQVQELAVRGCAVVLVTHNVLEAERAAQRLVIMNQGRVVAEGSPSQLRGADAERLRLELVATDEGSAAQLTAEMAGTEPVVQIGLRLAVQVDQGQIPGLLAWAQQEREAGRVDEFSVTPVSLEDVYIRLVGSDRIDGEGPARATLAA